MEKGRKVGSWVGPLSLVKAVYLLNLFLACLLQPPLSPAALTRQLTHLSLMGLPRFLSHLYTQGFH